MKKIYFLSTCDTCKKILSQLNVATTYNFQDLKKEPLSVDQLEALRHLSGTYECLFNKRARLYAQRGLKNKDLSERDYKTLLLEHYTFLKRPVIVTEENIFIGNAKSTIEAAKQAING